MANIMQPKKKNVMTLKKKPSSIFSKYNTVGDLLKERRVFESHIAAKTFGAEHYFSDRRTNNG